MLESWRCCRVGDVIGLEMLYGWRYCKVENATIYVVIAESK